MRISVTSKPYSFVLKIVVCIIVFASTVIGQNPLIIKGRFDNNDIVYTRIGKGECYIEDGSLISKEAYASFGNADWKNYRITFDARVPDTEEQVQIWAGFREQGRNDRYIVGLKGGLQNDLFLARLGQMGNDEFLGLRDLDFSPIIGKWYKIIIEVCEDRIRIFLNNEDKPRIDIIDTNADLLPSGKITLGGSWIKTEFDNLEVLELPEDYLDSVPVNEYTNVLTKEEKQEKRKSERSRYRSIVIKELNYVRTEASLDGEWLFKPGYEIDSRITAVSPEKEDSTWHIMSVPNFWNPSRIWLHGETFGKHAKGASDTYYQKETDRCENFTFDYKNTKEAWYRQWIELPENIEGKHLELSFDAVSKVAEVYINGFYAGSHIGMFGPFKIKGSRLFKPGKNLVAVHVLRDYVDHIEDAHKISSVAVTVEVTNDMLKDLAHGFFRENPAGIWQPVKMVISNPIKIEDVFIKPNLIGAEFVVTVKNHDQKKKTFNIQTCISDKKTKDNLITENSLTELVLAAGEEKSFTYQVSNLKPKLWTPQTPNLYDFSFILTDKKGIKILDIKNVCSGFRTFEARGDYFYLNGIQYWLRGANHTPFAMGTNDTALADKTYQLYKAANIEVTRTHTTPYNKLWMNAADQNGFGISFEGTWPWLMIEDEMPDEKLIELWRNEWYDIMKKYRNHPSLFIWTVNNEMKFYDNEPDFEVKKQKMKIISDVVKQMRKVDPTRPICFDSNYSRDEKKFGKIFFDTIDDGDIDDKHWYVNWYHGSLFNEFHGEFQKKFKNEGRPLINQEMSTGYPNSETGHATRFYTFVHQNPQSLVGNYAYPLANPEYFLKAHSFITAELAEAMRRSNDRMAGVLHFASITWFRNVYDAEKVEPYPVYYRMKSAMQPVLVSAELWGRHFYAGDKIPTRICIVNDKPDGKDLEPSRLEWQLTDETNGSIASGEHSVPAVKHYERVWVTPEIRIPANIQKNKLYGKLKLYLVRDNQVVSSNEYELLFAEKAWAQPAEMELKKIVVVDFCDNTIPVLNYLNITSDNVGDINTAIKQKADLYIISGLMVRPGVSYEEAELIRQKIKTGGRVLLLNSGMKAIEILPEYLQDYFTNQEYVPLYMDLSPATEMGEIVNIDVTESGIFNGIEPLDLRYFNDNQKVMPSVCTGAYQAKVSPKIQSLASCVKIHGYLKGDMKERNKMMKQLKGFPIISIEDGGKVILSEMMTGKGLYDPVAAKLLSNMIMEMAK